MPSAKSLLLTLLLLALQISRAYAQASLAWTSTFDDGDPVYTFATKADRFGNVYLTGNEDLGGARALFLLKYNSSGTIEYFNKYQSGGGVDIGYMLDFDAAGNVYVCGSSFNQSRDAAVFKFTPDGTLQWRTTFDGTAHLDDLFQDIKVDQDGNAVACGFVINTVTSNDFITAKIRPNGTVAWVETEASSPDTADDLAINVRIDSHNNVVVGGFTMNAGNQQALIVKYDSTGQFQWAQYSLNFIQAFVGIEIGSSDGVYLITNSDSTTGDITFLDSQSVKQWETVLPNHRLGATASDSSGNLLFGGTHGTIQCMGKISSTNVPIWATDNSFAKAAYHVSALGQNSYALGLGMTNGHLAPTVSKFNPSGVNLWNLFAFYHPESDFLARSLSVLPTGDIVLECDPGMSGLCFTASIFETPVAHDDQYSDSRNTSLSVSAANGVLSNDTFGQGGSVALVSSTPNGALTLYADGSFTYNPSAGFLGTDSFTYKIRKGQETSNVATASISVLPILTGLSLNPTTVVGGSPVTGTVTLDAAAPAGGAKVSMSASTTSIIPPPTVTVPAGSSSVNFTINTLVVDGTYVRQVTAKLNGVSKVANLTLLPPIKLTNFVVSPSTLIGGLNTTGTVTINEAAPVGGVVVALSDNSSALTTPASVTVPQGATSASFTIGTAAVAVQATRTVSATLSGATKTVNVTLLPGTALVSLTLNPTTVQGGHPSQGTVTLVNPAPAGGAVITLSANSSVITVPASVTVAAGSKTATFTANTAKVGATYTRTISASYQGVTKTANLTITP